MKLLDNLHKQYKATYTKRPEERILELVYDRTPPYLENEHGILKKHIAELLDISTSQLSRLMSIIKKPN